MPCRLLIALPASPVAVDPLRHQPFVPKTLVGHRAALDPRDLLREGDLLRAWPGVIVCGRRPECPTALTSQTSSGSFADPVLVELPQPRRHGLLLLIGRAAVMCCAANVAFEPLSTLAHPDRYAILRKTKERVLCCDLASGCIYDLYGRDVTSTLSRWRTPCYRNNGF